MSWGELGRIQFSMWAGREEKQRQLIDKALKGDKYQHCYNYHAEHGISITAFNFQSSPIRIISISTLHTRKLKFRGASIMCSTWQVAGGFRSLKVQGQ